MKAETRQPEKYVLYVNKSYDDSSQYCNGSDSCLRHVQQNADFLIQDVDEILRQGVELPSWLDGSPILVEVATGTASKGTHAVNRVKELVSKPRKAPPDASIERGNIIQQSSNAPSPPTKDNDDDPFNQNDKDAIAAAETSDRTSKKVDERALEALMAERQKTMDARSQPPSNALPPPLPADA